MTSAAAKPGEVGKCGFCKQPPTVYPDDDSISSYERGLVDCYSEGCPFFGMHPMTTENWNGAARAIAAFIRERERKAFEAGIRACGDWMAPEEIQHAFADWEREKKS